MHSIINDTLKIEIADLITADHAEIVAPFNINPYISMSAMQKAIRRDDANTALRATASLLRDNPKAFWRRLGVTAFEDIGIANPILAGHVSQCVNAKRFRDNLGGDWKVASHLVRRMCESPKDRSPDDLVVQMMHDTRLDDFRHKIAEMELPDRVSFLFKDIKPSLKGLSTWMSFGSDRVRGANIPEVKGDITYLFDQMLEHGLCATNVEIARLGVKKTGEVLPAFMPVMWELAKQQKQSHKDDDLPEVKMIGDIPSYVYDNHTRDGNACFREFVRLSEEMRSFLSQCDFPQREWSRIVGKLTFRVESGLLKNRLQWKTGLDLLYFGNTFGRGLNPKMVPEGLRLMKKSIPLLNEVRSDMIGGR